MGHRNEVRSDNIETDMDAVHYAELHRPPDNSWNTIVSMIILEA